MAALLCRAGLVAVVLFATRADAQVAEHAELQQHYHAQLRTFADATAASGLTVQAERVRRWIPEHAVLTVQLPMSRRVLDDSAANDELPADASAAERKWHADFQQLKLAQAEALFALTLKAFRAKHAAWGWQWMLEALRENPDHAAARKVLGHDRYEGAWRTPFEIGKLKAKQVWSPRFGWIAESELPRYEQGERYYRGKWISAAAEEEQRQSFDRGWEIITEHFVVRTNHSLEKGVHFATQLERLREAWLGMFVRFVYTEAELLNRAEGKGSTRQSFPRHSVWLFRDRDEYVEALKGEQPWIANTTGYYDHGKRRSFLYAGLADDSSIFHEATHQLFGELRQNRNSVGLRANFWVLEGVACYMESLVVSPEFLTLGGVRAVRLNDARIRLLRDNFHEPLGTLVGQGMAEIQKFEEIKKLYSEMAGLSYFLMHYEQGKYRDITSDYLMRVYQSKDTPTTLAELTGHSYAELDVQYRQFLEALAKSD